MMASKRGQTSKRGQAMRCRKCPDYVGDRGQMERHLVKEHMAEEDVPYLCKICCRRSHARDDLARHIRLKHPEVLAVAAMGGTQRRHQPKPEEVELLSPEESEAHYAGRVRSRRPAPSPATDEPVLDIHPSAEELRSLGMTMPPLSPLPRTPVKKTSTAGPGRQDVINIATEAATVMAKVFKEHLSDFSASSDVKAVSNQLMATNSNLAELASNVAILAKRQDQVVDCFETVNATMNGLKSELSRFNRGVSVMSKAVERLDGNLMMHFTGVKATIQGSIDTNWAMVKAFDTHTDAFKAVEKKLSTAVESCDGILQAASVSTITKPASGNASAPSSDVEHTMIREETTTRALSETTGPLPLATAPSSNDVPTASLAKTTASLARTNAAAGNEETLASHTAKQANGLATAPSLDVEHTASREKETAHAPARAPVYPAVTGPSPQDTTPSSDVEVTACLAKDTASHAEIIAATPVTKKTPSSLVSSQPATTNAAVKNTREKPKDLPVKKHRTSNKRPRSPDKGFDAQMREIRRRQNELFNKGKPS